jgi:hypothetical protein
MTSVLSPLNPNTGAASADVAVAMTDMEAAKAKRMVCIFFSRAFKIKEGFATWLSTLHLEDTAGDAIGCSR